MRMRLLAFLVLLAPVALAQAPKQAPKQQPLKDGEIIDLNNPRYAKMRREVERFKAANGYIPIPKEWEGARVCVVVADQNGNARGMPDWVYEEAIEKERLFYDFMHANGFNEFESRIVHWKFETGPDGKMKVAPQCVDQIGSQTLERRMAAEPPAIKEKAVRKAVPKTKRPAAPPADRKTGRSSAERRLPSTN